MRRARSALSRTILAAYIVMAALGWLWPDAVHAQEGIARKYLRDVGIESDPDVVFAENFENGTLDDIAARWTDRKNQAGMSLAADAPPDSAGTRSLLVTSVGGANTGGHLYRTLPPGHDRVYFRYYMKYAPGPYHHTGGWLGGYNPPTPWPQGGAGTRPTGSDRFSIGAEPVTTDLRFDLYVYWMHMRTNPGGGYWGNDFIQDPALVAPLNRWICVEVMVKLNNPVIAFNGELALWIDGRQIIHLREGSPLGRWIWDSFHPDPTGTPFEGFQWRSADALTVNWVMLQHYVTTAAAGAVGQVWFDHVVVARQYVGPLNTSPPGPPAAPTGLSVNPS